MGTDRGSTKAGPVIKKIAVMRMKRTAACTGGMRESERNKHNPGAFGTTGAQKDLQYVRL